MNKPIIGIMMRCASFNERNVQYVFESVRKSIIKCNGEPLLICPTKLVDYYNTKWEDFPDFSNEEVESIKYWINMCDGLFLPGGDKFTKFDLLVLDIAIKKNIPILGVCMGMQLMSCYKKDYDLYRINSTIQHNQKDSKNLYSHKIKIEKQSKLYKIINKDTISVNSFHKMAAKENPLFNISAVAEDGVIEGIEMKDRDFVIGLQWHPERNIDNDEVSKNIITTFINKAIEYKNNKS